MHDVRSGVRLKRLARTMRDLARQAQNLKSAVDLSAQKQQYLSWVRGAEGQLDGLFEDPSQWMDDLHTPHYWYIRDLPDASPRPSVIIGDEARRQADRLERLALAAEAEALIAWANRDAASLAVIDTHVLLHFEPPEQVNWLRILGSSAVRLVLPLRIIEELDSKKYTSRSDLAKRARGIVSRLRTELGADPQMGVPLREGVTMEVYMPSGPRRRSVDADQEVLDDCRAILSTGTDRLVLVTDDAGLDLRARAFGVPTMPMPVRYLREGS